MRQLLQRGTLTNYRWPAKKLRAPELVWAQKTTNSDVARGVAKTTNPDVAISAAKTTIPDAALVCPRLAWTGAPRLGSGVRGADEPDNIANNYYR